MADRVAIIGGGPGGLLVAHRLHAAAPGRFAVTVFEATDRPGGKLVTRRFDAGPRYEAGAAEFYDCSDALRRLVAELGLRPEPLAGEAVVVGGQPVRDVGDLGRVFGAGPAAAVRRFTRRARRQHPPAAFTGATPPAGPLTRRSFARLLARSLPDPVARRYVEAAVRCDLATEPHRVSAGYGLHNWLISARGYARLYRLAGGNDALPRALAARLPAGTLRLNRRVARVGRVPGGRYAVDAGAGPERFDAVVVALPAGWLSGVRWAGPLDRPMARHAARVDRPGHYLRVSVLFRRPAWPGFGSYLRSEAFGGCCMYDESAGGWGVLNWLLAGDAALAWANEPDDALVTACVGSLPAGWGDLRPGVAEARVTRWLGAVVVAPGRPASGDPHRPDPVGHPRLWVTGDYLHDAALNGAVESAERVAASILAPPE